MTQLRVDQATDRCEICGGHLDESLQPTGRHLLCGPAIKYAAICQEETCGRELERASVGRTARFCSDTCSKRHRRRQRAQKETQARLDTASGAGGSAGSGRDAGAEAEATTDEVGGLPAPKALSEDLQDPSQAVFPQVSEFPDTVPSRYYANNFSPELAREALRKPLTSGNVDQHDAEQTPDVRIRQGRRRARFDQRKALWSISSLERVRKCGKVVNQEGGGVQLVMKQKIGHWRGYCSCASIWICPVCGPKIRLVRANDIAMAVARHILGGGTAWMITLTARHKKQDELKTVFDAVAKGWPMLMSGKAWAGSPERVSEKTGKITPRYVGEKERLGSVGWIRSLEVTYGKNGFHPHLHVVLLLDGNEDPQQHVSNLARAMHRWKIVWGKWMAKHGFEPSDEHGIKWSAVTSGDQAGQYIAKTQEGGGIGNEMARGDLKRGKHKTLAPMELLEYFVRTGDADVIPIWHEYEQGTFRRRAITWGKGTRDRYLDHQELTEEEAAAEETGGTAWITLPAVSRKAMQKIRYLQSDLLDAAENEGFAGLVQLLTRYQLEFEIHDEALEQI